MRVLEEDLNAVSHSMSTEEKELEVKSTEAPKKPARKPRKPVDPAVWEELMAMQESGEVLTV